ncbi:MAG: Holliday junction resolvase-like protein, partial [Nanoarchaeota archaeon]|nr:Holliday junction resolvase-like protein [Nanoarchaeota archaeon]
SFLLYRLILFRRIRRWKETEMQKEIEKALERQRSVVKGKISEQLVPFLSDELGTPSDARFIGDPVDYVVFDGLSRGDDQKVSVKFVEVKTSGSKLNDRESRVRDAVIDKRVEWKEIRV